MHLLIIAWVYVVLMMAISEATSTQGTVLGALFTFLLYGVLPLSILLYLMRTPARRAKRRAQEQDQAQEQALPEAAEAVPEVSGVLTDTPDGSAQAARDAVPTERKEP